MLRGGLVDQPDEIVDTPLAQRRENRELRRANENLLEGVSVFRPDPASGSSSCQASSAVLAAKGRSARLLSPSAARCNASLKVASAVECPRRRARATRPVPCSTRLVRRPPARSGRESPRQRQTIPPALIGDSISVGKRGCFRRLVAGWCRRRRSSIGLMSRSSRRLWCCRATRADQ